MRIEDSIAELVAKLVDERLKLHVSQNESSGADDRITVAEFARRLGASDSYVRKQIRAGKLEAHRLGRAVRLRAGDVDKLITRTASKVDEVSKARERALRLARGRAA